MSSKKVAKKETKAPAKKVAAKPASKAPAKKPAASAAKKPAAKPAAKAPAKPVAKAAAAKASSKPSKDAKSVKAKSAPAKPVAKTAPKAAAKPAPKAAPKAKAPATAEPKKQEVATKKPVAKKEVKAEPKKSAPAKAPVKAPVKEEKASKKTETAPKAEPTKVADSKPETAKSQAEPAVDAKASSGKGKAPEYDYAVLLQGVKRLSKTIMFTKVDEAEDRSNKKKMSSDVKNLDVKPTSSIRHKASLAEETQEELTERILKELEEQNRIFEREAATQMCTRCNRNLVSPEFWVDKHLGFCEECAAILKLGQSKEARKVEYQLGAMDGDSLDEEDEDFIGPDADDLKEAEEDLAEMGE